ncbi:MAG: 30S ribosomal protein S7 [Candidatus Firestonebacteria bacterium]
MPRKKLVGKRETGPDPKFNDVLVQKLINSIMKQGKKSVAETIVYTSFEEVGKKANANGVTIFKQAMENIKPMLEVKPRRVGGATYQVPVEVPPVRRIALGIKWLVDAARGRSEKTMVDRLVNEITDASKNTGAACKKREDVHKMAEANKAFVHFRW